MTLAQLLALVDANSPHGEAQEAAPPPETGDIASLVMMSRMALAAR